MPYSRNATAISACCGASCTVLQSYSYCTTVSSDLPLSTAVSLSPSTIEISPSDGRSVDISQGLFTLHNVIIQ